MTSETRIKISAGLIGLALLHAVAMVVGFCLIHATPKLTEQTRPAAKKPLNIPRVADSDGYGTLPQPSITAPPINRSALDEIKQQCVGCGESRLQRVNRSGYQYPSTPSLRRPTVTQVQYPAEPTYAPTIVQPTPAPWQPASIPTLPTVPQSIVSNPQSLPAPKSYELALFVGNDAKSQQLLQWFNSDPTLQQLKSVSNFQTYTKDSPLYRTRYAAIVPAETFPAVVLQHADGAHIHAAGGNMVPSTPAQLMEDFRKGYAYSKQVRESDRQMTGLIGKYAYSWDKSITPSMQWAPPPVIGDEECIDGDCDRTRPSILDRVDKNVNQAVLWVGTGELIGIAIAGMLIFAILVLLGIIIWKRV